MSNTQKTNVRSVNGWHHRKAEIFVVKNMYDVNNPPQICNEIRVLMRPPKILKRAPNSGTTSEFELQHVNLVWDTRAG